MNFQLENGVNQLLNHWTYGQLYLWTNSGEKNNLTENLVHDI